MSSAAFFIEHVIETCKGAGIELILSPSESVYTVEGAACCGFFDDKQRTLACAVGHDGWLTTLAHEFAHLCQSLEGLFLPTDFGPIEPYALLDRWYAGEDFPADEVERAVVTCIECELDAERRALALMSRHNLLHDMSDYISNANGYALCYLWSHENRRWPDPVEWGGSRLVPRNRILAASELKLTKAKNAFIKKGQPRA